MQAATEPQRESALGWWMVVLAALFTGLGTGSLGSIAVFLKPLIAEFGWLRGDTAGAYLVGSIAMGAGGIGLGYLADRYAVRWVVLAGALALGSAYLLLAQVDTLWQLYAGFMLMGGLGVGAFDAPLLANVGSWFDRNKGLAIGIATAGRSLGQGFVPFGAGYLITTGDWRSAFLLLGFGVLVVLVPLALMVRSAPVPLLGVGSAAGSVSAPETVDSPISTRRFVAWLASAALFCCVTMATVNVHVAALALDLGASPADSAAVLLVIFIAGFFGRILFGKLADLIGGLRAYVVASFTQTVLVYWFTQVTAMPALYALAVAFGVGFSGVMTCVVVCVREYVPAHRRGLAQGIVLFLAWIGMGLGGWQGGALFDLTGGYTAPFAAAAAAGVVNLLVLTALLLQVTRRPSLGLPAVAPA